MNRPNVCMVQLVHIFLSFTSQKAYSALALVVSKIKVGTTGNPIGPRPKFSLKTSSYMSGELRECFNFKNIFAKNCRN